MMDPEQVMDAEQVMANISAKLSYFGYRVGVENRANLTAINIMAEGLAMEYLNVLQGWHLENANAGGSNAVGLDLRDDENKILVQVSATHTHEKVQDALNGSAKEKNRGYHFYFFAITQKAHFEKSFTVPDGLIFDEKRDIFDVGTLERQTAGGLH